MARDVYELGIFYKIGPQPGMNVLHFAEDTENSDDPDTNAHGCIAGFVTSILTPLLGTIPSTVQVLGFKCRRINNGGGPGISEPGDEGTIGNAGDGFSASAIGPCLIWSYEKFGGGWAAGRTFLPAVAEENIEENQYSEALLTNCNALIEALLAVPCFSTITPPLNFEFVIYSPTHEAISGVEAGHVSGKPGVQNRRLKPSF